VQITYGRFERLSSEKNPIVEALAAQNRKIGGIVLIKDKDEEGPDPQIQGQG